MSSFENFVQCRVVTPFTAAATEIGLFAADEPHRLPAEGGGVLVLTDSPYRPSALEVIRYGRRSGLALYEVSRAQEGTTARDWAGVAFCYQALTAGELERLLGEKADADALDGLRQEAETALDAKVDKIAGKGLSTNDYTTAEKNKLANTNLTALVGLTGAADRLPYFTGAGALSLATITAAARTLLAATNVTGQQSALGLFADASGVMTNGSGALTNWVSQLLRSADAAAARNTLGLGSAAVATLTASDLDTTTGRVLKIGDLNIGRLGTPASVFATVADWSKPVGWSGFVRKEGSVGWPGGDSGPSYIYYSIISKRDVSGGYAGIATDYASASTWVGYSQTNASEPIWLVLYHSSNQLSLGTTPASARTAMQLGTAATRAVQSSLYDATSNALMPTSAFGLGNTGPAQSISSFAQHRPGGFYRAIGADVPDGPYTTNTLGAVLTIRPREDMTTNIIVSALNRIWFGSHLGTSLGPWHEILHTGVTSALPITGSLSPATDNVPPLGEANKRWSTAHLGTAPIVTSDRDAKMDILPIDDAVLDAWATLGYMQYRLKDAVAAKGEAARTHAGLIAQDIREAFEAAGLDPFKYGVLCYDEWDDEVVEHPAEYEQIEVPAVLDDEGNEVEPARTEQGDLIQEARYEQGELIKEAWTEVVREAGSRYSVRYEEAFALECALQRRTTQRLEQRLAALESAA